MSKEELVQRKNEEVCHSLPELLQAHRILCVQPHYDDNDIGAGGTLAALHERGAELIYLTVTDDLVGVLDPTLPSDRAALQLKAEQRCAGEFIGVGEQIWLGYPDAGEFSVFALRMEIVRWIRQLRPDFIFTCDPWLPYEAHQDHIRTGLAVAEAAILYHLPRFVTDPEIDASYQPHGLKGVGFYLTHAPNLTFDISAWQSRKHRALNCYRLQFTPDTTEALHRQVEALERQAGKAAGFQFGEPLKLLLPEQLHLNPI
jgi:LmbE family N-acetylglucosaminyl deacetylase